MPAEQRDAAVTEKVGEQPSVTPDVRRPEVVGLLPKWIMALRSYSVCLKNLENINRDKKAEHLTKILSGWSTLLLYGCIVFKEAVEKKELQIGPMKFVLDLPANVDARVLRLIFLSIPIYISDLLRKDLGSQKLSVQLRNDELAVTLSDSFLQTSVYADLKLNEYVGRLKHLKERATEARAYVILEALLMKMRDIVMRLGLGKNEQASFIQLAAEMSADIKGLTGDDRQREIDKYSLDLRKHDQVNKIRERLG